MEAAGAAPLYQLRMQLEELLNLSSKLLTSQELAGQQVTAACLFILQSKVYTDYLGALENGEEPPQFTDWVDKMSKDRLQCLYWNRVLFLELCVLQFIRAIRE